MNIDQTEKDKSSMSSNHVQHVDQNAVKFSHAATIVLLALGFVVDSWVPVAVAMACQLLGASGSSFAPYRFLYEHVVTASGIIKPNVQPDNPQPHHFASLVGGLFNLVATLLLMAGSPIGWLFGGVVFVLANLNVWVGFCAGCTMYYQFNRLGVPGFTYAPVRGR